jgi:hypothetical protein
VFSNFCHSVWGEQWGPGRSVRPSVWLAHCFKGFILGKLKDFECCTQILRCLRLQEAVTYRLETPDDRA